ncbi:MAG TPA: hypothetical protein PKB10_13955, partial [Tepidisphaeraceae bacterium]|nr:hypothetical protein [Tepidisphaeraceae bacterium]
RAFGKEEAHDNREDPRFSIGSGSIVGRGIISRKTPLGRRDRAAKIHVIDAGLIVKSPSSVVR